MIKWKLEKRKLSSLKKYPKNPRFISKEDFSHLQKSIGKFGLIDKPIVNTDNTIIGGHQRIQVLQKQGIKEVECWVPDRELDEKEVEELNIRHNKNTGEFDFDILANQFEVEDLIGWGFTEDDLQIDHLDVVDSKSKNDDDKEEDNVIVCPKCQHEFLK